MDNLSIGLSSYCNKAKREPDALKRTQHFWNIVKVHIDEGLFFIGEVANYLQPLVVSNGLGNVPTRDNLAQHGLVNDWELPGPRRCTTPRSTTTRTRVRTRPSCRRSPIGPLLPIGRSPH